MANSRRDDRIEACSLLEDKSPLLIHMSGLETCLGIVGSADRFQGSITPS